MFRFKFSIEKKNMPYSLHIQNTEQQRNIRSNIS